MFSPHVAPELLTWSSPQRSDHWSGKTHVPERGGLRVGHRQSAAVWGRAHTHLPPVSPTPARAARIPQTSRGRLGWRCTSQDRPWSIASRSPRMPTRSEKRCTPARCMSSRRRNKESSIMKRADLGTVRYISCCDLCDRVRDERLQQTTCHLAHAPASSGDEHDLRIGDQQRPTTTSQGLFTLPLTSNSESIFMVSTSSFLVQDCWTVEMQTTKGWVNSRRPANPRAGGKVGRNWHLTRVHSFADSLYCLCQRFDDKGGHWSHARYCASVRAMIAEQSPATLTMKLMGRKKTCLLSCDITSQPLVHNNEASHISK